MRRRSFLSTAGLGAVGVAAAACGSSKSATPSSTAGSTTAGTSNGGSTGGPALNGTGPFTFVGGKDNSGFLPKQIAQWNKENPSEKCTFLQLSSAADAQRQSMVQNALAKSSTYGILSVDVVWTAEFAANGWILPLDESQLELSNRLPATVTTARYFNKLYAVPSTSDGGLLYYRKDLLEAAGVSAPPTTYAELISAYDKAKAKTPGLQGYAGQFQKYEGLTCNFSEVINSSGGTILDPSGKPNVNTAAAAKGLSFLTDGFKQGYIPKAALTFQEEDSRNAFQSGKLLFLRNWSYVYALASATDGSSKVAGKFGAVPLPGLDGPGVSTLGGHNLAVSSYCKNKASAIKFAKFFCSVDQQKANMIATTSAPTVAELYTDPALVKKFPFLPILKSAIEKAKKRPEAVNYNDVTTALQNAAYSALQGTESPTAALSQLQGTLSSALAKK